MFLKTLVLTLSFLTSIRFNHVNLPELQNTQAYIITKGRIIYREITGEVEKNTVLFIMSTCLSTISISYLSNMVKICSIPMPIIIYLNLTTVATAKMIQVLYNNVNHFINK